MGNGGAEVEVRIQATSVRKVPKFQKPEKKSAAIIFTHKLVQTSGLALFPVKPFWKNSIQSARLLSNYGSKMITRASMKARR